MADTESSGTAGGAPKSGAKAQPVIIKKYANRRLYNTATSSYVTLDHLCHMVRDNVDFVVYDAKTGEDITRSVLTQIIVEEEAKGQNLLPINFLRQLISFYGDNMQFLVPRYLEHMMQAFTSNQDRMKGAMKDAMGNFFPFGNLEEMGKQNMAMFEQAMKMWTPLAQGKTPGAPDVPGAQPTPPSNPLDLLKMQMEALQRQLNAFSKGTKS